MEGTRHERSAIVIASYIIGFVTAFIFAANTVDLTADPFTSASTNNPAAVAVAQPEVVKAVSPATAEAAQTGVTYENGQLMFAAIDGERLLSFNPEESELRAELETLTQGYHYGKLSYAVSPDAKFVFFCENKTQTDDECTGYVYESNADRIYQMTSEGSLVTFNELDASTAVWTPVGLKVGSIYSVNPSAPWVMMPTEGTLDLQ